MHRSILFGILLLSGINAIGQNVPSTGILHNASEDQSLTYDCTHSDAILDCSFTQVSVRRKAAQEDRGNLEHRVREEFPTYEPMSKADCEGWSTALDIVEGRKPAPKAEAFRALPDFEKNDGAALIRALLRTCESHTIESYLNLALVGWNKDKRTCRVASHSFRQRFKRVVDTSSGSQTWVVDAKAEGPCGIVQLSRFEVASDTKSTFWNYVSRKAVTNPSATLAPGLSCSGLDEAQYLYQWRERDHALGCDYIEFSPL